MKDSIAGNGGRRSERLFIVATRLAVTVILLFALVGTTGVAVAQDGNPGQACPGENPNQGLERSTERGNPQSVDTFVAVVCPHVGCEPCFPEKE